MAFEVLGLTVNIDPVLLALIGLGALVLIGPCLFYCYGMRGVRRKWTCHACAWFWCVCGDLPGSFLWPSAWCHKIRPYDPDEPVCVPGGSACCCSCCCDPPDGWV